MTTTTETDLDADAEVDDTGVGLAMFLIFSAAVLLVSGAVALVALVGSWLILGVAFAFHIIMTAIVIVTIVRAMNGRSSGPLTRLARLARLRPAPGRAAAA